jgi:hypothetical protein
MGRKYGAIQGVFLGNKLACFKRVTTTGSHFTVFLEEERLLDEEVFLRGLEEEEEEEEEEEDAPTSPAFLFFAAVFLVGIVLPQTLIGC